MSKKLLLLSSALLIAAISSASAADLPVYTKAPPPPPAFSWTGFYIGANIGGKWADVGHEVTGTTTTFTFNRDTTSSFIGGGQIGYNWQTGAWVFGIEGDIDAQDFHRDRTVATTIGPFVAGDVFSVESRWQASLRGRIGYAAWDRTLLYVTGGGAWTNFKGTASLVGVGTFTGDRTISGGTVGLGLEYALRDNISLGVEGRWSFYGDRTLSTPLGSDKVSLDTAEVLAKLNFHFR